MGYVNLKVGKFNVLVATMLLLTVAACKKDSTQQSTVSFSINGNAKSFTIYTNTLANYDTLGIQEKTLVLASAGAISGPALSSGFAVVISQNLALPGSNTFRIGAYPDELTDTACVSSGYSPNCEGFFFTYYDSNYGSQAPDNTDTTGLLNITAFSTPPNLVSGNFKCRVTDGNGNYYSVTNGLFTNVPYVVQ